MMKEAHSTGKETGHMGHVGHGRDAGHVGHGGHEVHVGCEGHAEHEGHEGYAGDTKMGGLRSKRGLVCSRETYNTKRTSPFDDLA